MYVGICRFSFVVVHSHSLKEKRSAVRRLRDRVQQRFQVGLVEVGGQDTWQRADLAFSVLTGTRDAAEAAVAGVLAFTAAQGAGEVTAARHEVLAFGDDWFAAATPWEKPAAGVAAAEEDWIPASWRDEESRG